MTIEKTFHVLICAGLEDFDKIPAGAAILGISGSPHAWEGRERCTLGIVTSRLWSDGFHAIAHECLSDESMPVQAFLQAVRQDPDTAWLVASRWDSAEIFGMALLNLRAQAALEGEHHAGAGLTTQAVAFAWEVDRSERHVKGWDERSWPGPQGGYTLDAVWKEVGHPQEVRALTMADQVVRLSGMYRGLTLEFALATLRFWLQGAWMETPGGSFFPDVGATIVEAVGRKDYGRVLQAALQRATQTRYALVQGLETSRARPELILDGRVALLDFTDGRPAPDDLDRIGLCVAPVAVVAYRDGEQEPIRFTISSRGSRFDSIRFALRAQDAESNPRPREWGQIVWQGHDHVTSPQREPTSLTLETVLKLVHQHLR